MARLHQVYCISSCYWVTSYSLSFIYVKITEFHLPCRRILRKLEVCRESVQTESLGDSQHLVRHTKSTDASILSKSKRFVICIAYLNILRLPIQIKSWRGIYDLLMFVRTF